MLSEFDFEIRHTKGKLNKVVDPISRRLHVNHIEAMSSYGTYLQD